MKEGETMTRRHDDVHFPMGGKGKRGSRRHASMPPRATLEFNDRANEGEREKRIAELEEALRGVLSLTVAKSAFEHLNRGIGTKTDEGLVWLRARDVLANASRDCAIASPSSEASTP
jgi:hypothetical protein